MDLIEYVDGARIVTPERPLEPPDCWWGEPEETGDGAGPDDGIDLDDGWVLQLGKGWRRMTRRKMI